MPTFEVTTDGKTLSVVADSTDHNQNDGNLRLWKDGAIVAEFQWWNSIVRKDDV
ncbi:hypothetical protein [Nocardioides zeae]